MIDQTGDPPTSPIPILRCGPVHLALDRPRVMGIVNVTPDSFSDGGRFVDVPRAIAHARALIDDGADILDVGGESTRPGSTTVPADEELARVLPVIAALAPECAERQVPLSIDTRKPKVMEAAIRAGATLVNDVMALTAPGALDTVARHEVAVCLMHMQGEPATMQHAPRYADVVAEIRSYLRHRAESCVAAGIARERIVVDPGFGFGKSLAHNLELLRHMHELVTLGYPVLVGLSRKNSVGTLSGRAVTDRTAASVAAALAAVARGALIVRVHDVRETADALRVWCAVFGGQGSSPDAARSSTAPA